MVNREMFFKQVEELIITKGIDRLDFQILFEVVNGKDMGIEPGFVADKIVNTLFGAYSEQLIPWSFLQTEIGKALLLAKFEIGVDVYFVSDLVAYTEYTRQYISKEIKQGNIEHQKREGIIYFTEKAVNDYLKKKGFQTLTERKSIKYSEVKEKHVNGSFERESQYGDK